MCLYNCHSGQCLLNVSRKKTQVCKFETQIIKKTKLMTHTHYSGEIVFAVLSSVIVANMKHPALHLQQDDIPNTCQSTF